MYKIYLFTLIIAAIILSSSCINDSEEITEDINSDKITIKERVVIKIDSTKTQKTEEAEHNTSVKKVPESKPKSESNSNTKNENIQDPIITTADDLEGQLKSGVNSDVNPDNSNAPIDIYEASNINLIPIYSKEDKEKYFVLFKESPNKTNKKLLSKYFSSAQDVYVVNHQGIYKYCIGKFDTEDEAMNHKTKMDKEHNLKGTKVINFKDAW